MFVVALLSLGKPLADAAQEIAQVCGGTAYELRLLLAPGLPALLNPVPDRATALAQLQSLRALGHDATAFDAAAVTPHHAMVPIVELSVSGDALLSGTPGERLLFDDVLAVLRAAHKHSVEVRETVKEKKFSMGRAIMTGGLMMRKGVEKTQTTRGQDKDPVLYLFRRSGQTPWILRGAQAKYHPDLGVKTSIEGLQRTLQLLQDRAPNAVFDDTLTKRTISDRMATTVASASQLRESNEAGVDLLAHTVALALARKLRQASG